MSLINKACIPSLGHIDDLGKKKSLGIEEGMSDTRRVAVSTPGSFLQYQFLSNMKSLYDSSRGCGLTHAIYKFSSIQIQITLQRLNVNDIIEQHTQLWRNILNPAYTIEKILLTLSSQISFCSKCQFLGALICQMNIPSQNQSVCVEKSHICIC